MILLTVAILALIAACCFLFVNPPALGIIPALLAAIVLVYSCSTVVQAKNVGVVTSFGAPRAGGLEPGFHFKAPWMKVTDIDGTIQTRQYASPDDCLSVRIGDGSRSCAQMTLRWKINTDKAADIYADYRADNPTDEVGNKLVTPKLTSALQATLGDYNPVALLTAAREAAADGDTSNVTFAPDYQKLSNDLLDALRTQVANAGDLVEILSVDVTYVPISDNTQKQLDDFNKALAATAIAQQNGATSQAQADANAKLVGSVDQPGIIEARCLDALNTAIQKGYQLPAGFNCTGSSGAVVVPAGK